MEISLLHYYFGKFSTWGENINLAWKGACKVRLNPCEVRLKQTLNGGGGYYHHSQTGVGPERGQGITWGLGQGVIYLEPHPLADTQYPIWYPISTSGTPPSSSGTPSQIGVPSGRTGWHKTVTKVETSLLNIFQVIE